MGYRKIWFFDEFLRVELSGTKISDNRGSYWKLISSELHPIM